MIVSIADFSILANGLKQLRSLCGTKIVYAEVHFLPDKGMLEVRAGNDELSARLRVPDCTAQEFNPDKPRFGLNLEIVEDAIATKRGPGTIATKGTRLVFNIGTFEATCAGEELRARQLTEKAGPGRPKNNVQAGYYYSFPRADEVGGPFIINQLHTAYAKIALEDQTKGNLFAKGAFFGIRVMGQELHLIAYDTVHVGRMRVLVAEQHEHPTDEDGVAADILLTRNMAQRIAKALGDEFVMRLGSGGGDSGDWLVAYNDSLTIACRTFDVRYNLSKVWRHLTTPITELFTIPDVSEVAAFCKRVGGTATATLTTRKSDVLFVATSATTQIKEPMTARVITKGETIVIPARSLLDCCIGLSGQFDFGSSERFIRLASKDFEFLVARDE